MLTVFLKLKYKMSSRLVRVSEKQRNDAVRMLELMGIPAVVAPSEAEAQ
jgi:5'-3' exonuclease